MCTDDKRNSFGCLGRRFVIEAVGALVRSEPSVDHDARCVYEAILSRVFVSVQPSLDGSPTDWNHRTVHIYPTADNESHTNHALTQGSAESSLLEAVTYASIVPVACTMDRQDDVSPPRALSKPMRLGMHDDAITLGSVDATVADMSRQADHAAGAKFAPEKSRATLAAFCHDAKVATSIDIAPAVLGIPVGVDPTLWIRTVFVPSWSSRAWSR